MNKNKSGPFHHKVHHALINHVHQQTRSLITIITQRGRGNIPANVITVTNSLINVKLNVFVKSYAA